MRKSGWAVGVAAVGMTGSALTMDASASPRPAFTSATQLSNVTSALVDTTATLGGYDAIDPPLGVGFDVYLAPSLICPGGHSPQKISISFSDPTGTIQDTLADPCAGTWTPNGQDATNNLDFGTFPAPMKLADPCVICTDAPDPASPESGPADTFGPPTNTEKPVPFVWTVSGPAGTIARGSVTAQSTPDLEIPQGTDDFVNVCINQRLQVHSVSGKLYCTQPGSTTYSAGWPKGARPAKTRRIYVQPGAAKYRYKPSEFCIGSCDIQVYALRYSTYGGAQAHARGYLTVARSRPSAVAVTLAGVEDCAGRRTYTKVSWRYLGPALGRERGGTIKPTFETCSRER